VKTLHEVEAVLENAMAIDEGRYWDCTFRERFCQRYKCAPENFEKAVFFRTVHLYAWPFAKFLFPRDPLIFREDIEFIHEIGGVRDPLIFKSEVNRYHGRNVRERGWLRGTFHIRVSAKRVINLKNRLFRQN